MKSLWWKSVVIGLVSQAAVMAIAQTVNAPYPSLLPLTNADKSAPVPMLGTKSAIAPAAAPLREFTASGVAKGSAPGASNRDFKPVGRTTAQALVAPSTIIAVAIIGGLVALGTSNVGGGNSSATSTN